jgi:hypothetical protein
MIKNQEKIEETISKKLDEKFYNFLENYPYKKATKNTDNFFIFF